MLVLCAYYTSVSVQTANQIGVCSVGLSLVDRSGVWCSLLAPLTILMTLPPADDDKMKKNRTSGTPTSKKTSDSASSSKVCHTKVKLKISETNFCKSYGPASE